MNINTSTPKQLAVKLDPIKFPSFGNLYLTFSAPRRMCRLQSSIPKHNRAALN